MFKSILSATALAFALVTTAHAQSASPAPSEAQEVSANLTRRADDVVKMINGGADPTAIFAKSFLDQAPAERVKRLAQAVRQRHGDALGVARIEATSAREGTMYLLFAATEIPVLLQIEGDEEARIEGLLFQNMQRPAPRR